MPWKIGTHPDCSASKPHAVLKADDGKLVGCHATREQAEKQMAALHANEETMKSAPPTEGLVRAQPDGLELREATDGGRPTLSGHFAVFDEWALIDSVWEGRFLEKIAAGAFKKTITENRARMRVLFEHGQNALLGNQPLGTIRSLEETDRGAAYEVELFDGIPPLILAGLRANQYGSSFRFSVLRESFDQSPEKSEHNPEGIAERVVQEARVPEFGPVAFPAYIGADAGLRSLTDRFVLPQNLLERLGAAAPTVEPTTPPGPVTPDKGRSTQPTTDYLRERKDTPSWLL